MSHPDYTPDFNKISNRGAFRFWCQKVLPLVYDDSLSYYELLGKVIEYLNNTMNDVKIIGGNVDSLKEAYTEFQNYLLNEFDTFNGDITNKFKTLENFVNTYFEELDVTQEVSDKLDEMAASGALSNLLAPLIPNLVTSWLNEKVTPVGSAVVVDSSLSVSGAAADAKETGNIRAAAALNFRNLAGVANVLYGNNKTITASSVAYQYTNMPYPLKKGKRYKCKFTRSIPATANVLLGSANDFTYVDEFIVRLMPGESSIEFTYVPTNDAANFRVEFSELSSGIIYTIDIAEELPTKNNIRTKSALSGTPRYGFMQRGVYSGEESGYYQTLWFDVEGLYSVELDIDTSYYHDIYAILDKDGTTISYLTSDSNSHYTGTVDLPANAKYFVISENSETKLSNAIVMGDIRNESENLVGKKIVWYGTSIPAAGKNGYGNYNSYPMRLGALLGATVFNEAIGSSPVHCRRSDFVSASNPYGFIEPFDAASRCLSNSLVMQEWIINNYTMFRDAPPTLTEADKEFIRSCSYENRIDKYLTKENEPDIWVFDHGINDYMGSENEYSESDPYSTFTFQGGFNFLINRIKQYNPRAKIIIISNYEKQRNPTVAHYQEKVANRWEFPFYRLFDEMGWNNYTITTNGFWREGFWETKGGTNQTISYINIWCADNLHPHTDKTGRSLEYYARILFEHFKNISLKDYYK